MGFFTPNASNSTAPSASPFRKIRERFKTKNTKPAVSAPSSPQTPKDPVTLTLAQRLNELAASNSEGLLNDEEYRLLRANLFERFAGNSAVAVPSEVPVVPASSPGKKTTPPNQFQVDRNTPSLRSSDSRTTINKFSALVRRVSSTRLNAKTKAMHRRSKSSDEMGGTGLRHRQSESSLRTQRAHITPPRWDGSLRVEPASRSNSRRSNPTSATPPSSYPHRLSTSSSAALDSAARPESPPPPLPMDLSRPPSRTLSRSKSRTLAPSLFSSTSISSLADPFAAPTAKTAAALRVEIESVERAGRRIVEGFNGLELSALTKTVRSTTPSASASVAGSVRSGSIRSGSLRSRTPNPAGRLLRKTSVSSTNSASQWGASSLSLAAATPPSLSPMPSSPSLAPSNFEELDTEAFADAESELSAIRTRRQEVSARYEARLEYLRAKLKGAELHERVAGR